MGMFDNIRCKHSLLNPNHRELGFQTKSLNRSLEQYEIASDGCLYRATKFYGDEYPIEHNDDDICGEHPISWERIDYTGEIIFYTFEDLSFPTPEGKWSEWIEYSAVFFNGRLQSITRLWERK